jgi:hypothetical protein
VEWRVQANVSQNEKHTASIFRAVDGESMFIRDGGIYLRIYTASKPRTTPSNVSLSTENQLRPMSPTFLKITDIWIFYA